jgi:hypothetical protein
MQTEHDKALAEFPMVCTWGRNEKQRVVVTWQQDPPLKRKPLIFVNGTVIDPNK